MWPIMNNSEAGVRVSKFNLWLRHLGQAGKIEQNKQGPNQVDSSRHLLTFFAKIATHSQTPTINAF